MFTRLWTIWQNSTATQHVVIRCSQIFVELGSLDVLRQSNGVIAGNWFGGSLGRGAASLSKDSMMLDDFVFSSQMQALRTNNLKMFKGKYLTRSTAIMAGHQMILVYDEHGLLSLAKFVFSPSVKKSERKNDPGRPCTLALLHVSFFQVRDLKDRHGERGRYQTADGDVNLHNAQRSWTTLKFVGSTFPMTFKSTSIFSFSLTFKSVHTVLKHVLAVWLWLACDFQLKHQLASSSIVFIGSPVRCGSDLRATWKIKRMCPSTGQDLYMKHLFQILDFSKQIQQLKQWMTMDHSSSGTCNWFQGWAPWLWQRTKSLFVCFPQEARNVWDLSAPCL